MLERPKTLGILNDLSPIITPKSNISNSFFSHKELISQNLNTCLKLPSKSLSNKDYKNRIINLNDLASFSKTHTTTNESFSIDQKMISPSINLILIRIN